MSVRANLVGQRFGRLVVTEFSHVDHRKNAVWRCLCDCGNQAEVPTSSLRSGNTTSCGCLHRELTAKRSRKHGAAARGKTSRLYVIWQAMRQRCHDPNFKSYPNYGGRGISICPEWAEFESFRKWALANGYRKDLTIDRINNDGDYEPANCRWVSLADQAANKRNTHLITFQGRTQHLAAWSRELGIDHSLLRYRLARWGVERAFKTPIRGKS